MNKEIALGLTRHILTATGGAMAANYGIDGATLEAVIGAVLTLIGFVWSIYDKRAK